MNPPDDWQLVDEYASSGSHAAFDALVKRHSGWIYATARRRVKSADLAEDVTQATFIVLARKARSIRRRESLAAWLYRVANYAALDALRRQGTRRRIERLAAKPEATMPAEESNEEIGKYLNSALNTLGGRDREAIILRYFNDQTLEQIGKEQHVAASTVQRRLERSLAQIGYQLKRNGVVTTPAAIGVTLGSIGAFSAPSSAIAGLTAMATAAGALPASTAGPIGLAKGTLKTMTIIKLKLAAAAVIAFVVACAGGVAITRAIVQSVPGAAAPGTPAPPTTSAAVPTTAPLGDADFANQFRMDWQSINLNVAHVNPADPQMRANGDTQTLSIQATLTIRDAGHIVGFDQFNSARITRIVDDSGEDRTSMATDNSNGMRWYQPLQYSEQFDNGSNKPVEYLRPQNFALSMKADSSLPMRLALVAGSLRMLSYDHMEQVDVPYVANGPATKVLQNLRLRFAEAAKDANSYHYQLVNEGGEPSEAFDGQLREGVSLPDRMILEKYLVDSAGKALENHHSYGNFPGNVEENGTGGMAGSDKIAAMRFEIAVGLKEVRVPFSLKNIDVPHLAVPEGLPTGAASPSMLDQLEESLASRLQNERDRAPANGWNDAKDQRVRDLWKQYVADWNAGVSAKVTDDEVMGLMPDVTSYDQYVGSYQFTPPQMTIQRGNQPPTTVPGSDQRMTLKIVKDAQGRLTMEIKNGKSALLACRDGALLGVIDPMFMPSDRLDPKSAPKLAGVWIVRSGGHFSLLTDTGRRMMPIVLTPINAIEK